MDGEGENVRRDGEDLRQTWRRYWLDPDNKTTAYLCFGFSLRQDCVSLGRSKLANLVGLGLYLPCTQFVRVRANESHATSRRSIDKTLTGKIKRS